MLSTPQANLVAHFEQLRQDLAAGVGQIVPATVDPYAGQLLNPEALLHAAPALWVDVEDATIDAVTEGGDQFATELTVELVLCALNQAAPSAQYSDGIALASWAVAALLSEPLPVSDLLLRPVGPVRFRRIASDDRFYAARIVADLEIEA